MAKNCSNAYARLVGVHYGFQVWELSAFNEKGQCIVKVTEDMESHVLKYKYFCNKVTAKGYQLTPAQKSLLTSTLGLSFQETLRKKKKVNFSALFAKN